jgi:hypothetical protein
MDAAARRSFEEADDMRRACSLIFAIKMHGDGEQSLKIGPADWRGALACPIENREK